MLYQIKVSRCVKENIKQILNCPRNLSIHLVMYHQCSLFCKSNIIIISFTSVAYRIKQLFGFGDCRQLYFLAYPNQPGQRLPRQSEFGARGSQSLTLVSLLNSLVLETIKYFIFVGAFGTVFLVNYGFSNFKQNLLGLTSVSAELFSRVWPIINHNS